MTDEKIKIGISEIQNIKMTENEKENILKSVLSFSILTKPIKSPYSLISIFQKNHLIYYGFAFCLLLILGGGTAINYFQNQKIGENTGTLTSLPKETPASEQNLKIAKLDGIKTNTSQNKKITSPLPSSPIAQNKNSENISSSSTTANMMAPTMGNININQNYTNIASAVFIDWLKQLAQKNGGMLDYKINNITFVALKATAQDQDLAYFSANTTNDAFIVSVNYSVQSTLENKIYWEAGNGKIGTDDWILNKSLFITIDKNSNGYYVKNAGTGL